MNTTVREVHTIRSNDGYQQAEGRLSQHREFWKTLGEVVRQTEQVIPFSVISGIIFIACMSFYGMHSQTLTLKMEFGVFVLLVTGCFISVLSLLTEKGGLHKVQAVSCLVSNTLLAIPFYNFLTTPLQH